MPNHDELKAGRRVRLLEQMTNKNSSWKPVEENMTAGLEGTIVFSSLSGPPSCHQILVKWDNGSHLNLLPYVDVFEVLPEEKE